MRVAIQTLGTRGDVQPYLALALGLMARGHAVQLAAPQQFEALVSDRGLPFVALPGEFLALLDTPEGKAAVAGSNGFGAGFKLLKHVRPLMRRLWDAEWDGVRAFAPDVIVYHPKSIVALDMAQALKVPAILASPLPGFTPTSAFPTPLLPFASLGPLNRASHYLMMKSAALMFGGDIRRWRQERLATLLPGAGAPAKPSGTLYAYSARVVPVPDDWGSDVCVTGYWFLDSGDWRPDAALSEFLSAGDPPVYVGFGSMPGLEPEKFAALVVDALAQAGKRGILATGGGALRLERLPPHVHAITAAPHDKLLPLVCAGVQHGGAGTTAASLRAGRPTAICPFFGDQPFWARRVAALGVGPKALDRKTLTAETLAGAITAMADPAMLDRAARLGALLRTEDGVGTAVAFIESRGAMPANETRRAYSFL